MTESEFDAYRQQGYTRVPLVRAALADLETPLALYLKLVGVQGASPQQRGRDSFLLESVVGGERFGRYSFIGLPARERLVVQRIAGEPESQVWRDGELVERQCGDPLAFMQQWFTRGKTLIPPGMPRFCGGLAGYFGYDCVRYMERRLARTVKPDPLGTPDALLLRCDELAVIDNLQGKLYLIVYADTTAPQAYARAQTRLDELTARLDAPVHAPPLGGSSQGEVRRDFAKDDYLRAVLRTKEYIAAGDLMQVQIGQRLTKPFHDSPISLYRVLRTLNPSPYMYYYDFGEFQVVGASPEILVRCEPQADGSDQVIVRPIAGTRPRGATPEEDARLEQELTQDPKERAEHVMLIDLARNDIGRVSEYGSVKVTEQFVVERYSHVMHMVSHVEGRLRTGLGAMDVLRACFPAGTLTGAPKVRAMEIIDELEPIARGIYGGAAGYWSYSGAMDLAIAIRTGIVKQGQLHVQAAAGIVADSVPEMEWMETEHKARALIRAAELVQQGVRP